MEWVNDQVNKGTPNADKLELTLTRLESQLADLHHQLERSPSTSIDYGSPNVFQLFQSTQHIIDTNGVCIMYYY